MERGIEKPFNTFGPLAIAVIGGSSLPLPTLSRSVVINMQRTDGTGGHRRLDDATAQADLDTAYRCAFAWARTVELNPEPDLPPELKARAADNWRVLVSIADSFGPQWGEAARAAAVELTRGYVADDVGVTLLADIRTIFDTLGVDRLASVDLVQHLIDLDDGSWGEFRGLRGDQYPRRISRSLLASLLRPFGIRSKKFWPLNRNKNSHSYRGYVEAQFTTVWAKYCPTNGTSAQPSKVKGLGRHKAGT
jgi:hypothetical protein